MIKKTLCPKKPLNIHAFMPLKTTKYVLEMNIITKIYIKN